MEQLQHQQYDTSSTFEHNEKKIEADQVPGALDTAPMQLSDTDDTVRSVTSESSDATSQPPCCPTPVWFSRSKDCKGAQLQMFDRADDLGHKVYVARDSDWGNGCKEYTSFMDHVPLAEMLISCLNNKQPCCLYEIIREGKPCNLHLDIEWESSMIQRDAHSMLSNVVSKLEKMLKVLCWLKP